MSNFVFVLDSDRRPLDPVHPAQARHLLTQGKAAVFRRYPFTLILKERSKDASTCALELKLDPGSKVTGIAISKGGKILFGAELQHRGQRIKDDLLSRHLLRRGRRNRKTRYREARFLNRGRPVGWLAPSLQHRVDTTMTWVRRLCKLASVRSVVVELVRFDLQQIENPEISGIEYQRGELQGYEVKEYLLEKWERKCAYCGTKGVSLEVDHIHPKSKGGTDRISNLALSCRPCNQAKGNQDIREFLSCKPTLLDRILKQAKAPLRDAAAVNQTRWALLEALKEAGLPVSTSSGGRTKYNRSRLGLPKAHWIDAACVGTVDTLKLLTWQPLLIAARGHGNRRMCVTDRYGFPSCHRTRKKIHFGFRTGDMVRAKVLAGKYVGTWEGRIVARARPSFRVVSTQTLDTHPRNLRVIHRSDGYSYSFLQRSQSINPVASVTGFAIGHDAEENEMEPDYPMYDWAIDANPELFEDLGLNIDQGANPSEGESESEYLEPVDE